MLTFQEKDVVVLVLVVTVTITIPTISSTLVSLVGTASDSTALVRLRPLVAQSLPLISLVR